MSNTTYVQYKLDIKVPLKENIRTLVAKYDISYILIGCLFTCKSKIDLINYMMDKVDAIFIGGAMAFTFLKANGVDIGASLVDNGKLKSVSHPTDDEEENADADEDPGDVEDLDLEEEEPSVQVVRLDGISDVRLVGDSASSMTPGPWGA
mgnify:CR=1 FL=1